MQNNSIDILIVEDDEDLVAQLSACLLREGLSVDRAGTVREALEKLPIVTPSVVLLDYMLPDGLGTKVERFVRSHPNLYMNTEIIFQTAVDDPVDLAQLRRHHSGHLLVKPYKAVRLMTEVQKAKNTAIILKCKTSGLPGLGLFKRELDYRFLRQEIKEAAIFMPTYPDPDLLEVSQTVSKALRIRGCYESSLYHVGSNIFGIVLVEKDLNAIQDGICEILRVPQSKLEKRFLLKALDLRSLSTSDFDLDKILAFFSSAVSTTKPSAVDVPKQKEKKIRPVSWMG